MPIDISFIIINYNTFELTCKCISSIKTKVHDVGYEIILVDNASVEISADKFLEKFPDIKLIKSDVNLGFAKGNNLGISHARGNYICLINSDASLKSDFDTSAIDLLKNNELGFLTGKLVFPNGEVQHNCQPFPS